MNNPSIEALIDLVLSDAKTQSDGCRFCTESCKDNLLAYIKTNQFTCSGKCDFCSKYKWIVDRAKEYAEVSDTTVEHVLLEWEKSRNCWYMNYYQECNQPHIKPDPTLKFKAPKVHVFDTPEDLIASIGDKGFRCPYCGGISTSPYECNSGNKVSHIGKEDKTERTCNWCSYGFLRTLGKGATVYVKSLLQTEEIFMPIAWENQSV